MKRLLVIVLILSFAFTGCATFDSQELNSKVKSLDRRVGDLEDRQSILETKVGGDIDVVSETTVEYAEEISDIKMSDREVQTILKEAGYYYGSVDGKIGPQTKKAIREFQADNRLKVDGILGRQTKKALLRYKIKN